MAFRSSLRSARPPLLSLVVRRSYRMSIESDNVERSEPRSVQNANLYQRYRAEMTKTTSMIRFKAELLRPPQPAEGGSCTLLCGKGIASRTKPSHQHRACCVCQVQLDFANYCWLPATELARERTFGEMVRASTAR